MGSRRAAWTKKRLISKRKKKEKSKLGGTYSLKPLVVFFFKKGVSLLIPDLVPRESPFLAVDLNGPDCLRGK